MAKKKTESLENSESPESASVEAAAEPMVRLQYLGDNHHIVAHVHALRPGENLMPAVAWEKAKAEPHNAMLLKKGQIVELDGKPVELREDLQENESESKV